MIKVNELFYSIQGESSLAGLPTYFIRTTGCPLRCVYCDTKYAYSDGKDFSVEDLITEVKKSKTNQVCITGGEPLIQNDVYSLISRLCDLNYSVSVETSGNVFCDRVDSRARVILDIKTPGSGEGGKLDMRNLTLITSLYEVKFVIHRKSDFEWSEFFCRQQDLFKKCTVLYSPSWGKISPKWLAEKILTKQLPVRIQLQLHKIIWEKNLRGV